MISFYQLSLSCLWRPTTAMAPSSHHRHHHIVHTGTRTAFRVQLLRSSWYRDRLDVSALGRRHTPRNTTTMLLDRKYLEEWKPAILLSSPRRTHALKRRRLPLLGGVLYAPYNRHPYSRNIFKNCSCEGLTAGRTFCIVLLLSSRSCRDKSPSIVTTTT